MICAKWSDIWMWCRYFNACIILLHISVCCASLGKASFDSGNYVANWTYYPELDKISVHVEVKTPGWVGFGFAEKAPMDMQDYDVIVGGFADGSGYLKDYYTGGESRPPLDAKQDYNLTNVEEENGKTVMTFERKRDTGDNKDVQLKAGVGVHLIWAYHSSREGNDPTNFLEHSKKGSSVQKHVIVPAVDAMTTLMTFTSTSVSARTKLSKANIITVLAVTMSIYL